MKKFMIFLMTIAVLLLFLGGGFLFGLQSMVNPNAGEITADFHWYNKRYPEAVEVAKSMAEIGDPWAELRMGAYYMFGQGVPKDDKIAMFWLKKASVHYNASRWSQGRLFSHGQPGHFSENQDALNAQYNLSVFYLKVQSFQEIWNWHICINEMYSGNLTGPDAARFISAAQR